MATRPSVVGEVFVLTHDEESRHPLIQGVLSVTVNGCRGLDTHGDTHGENVYVKISVRGYVTRTRVVRFNDGNPQFDQTFNIPVTVVRNARHPFNWVRVEVFRFASVYRHNLIGSMSFHLHHIIQSKAVKDRFSLFHGEVDSGDIDVRMLFSYGLYGYGHSDQFKNENTPKHNVSEWIETSLFPRVRPPAHRIDGNRVCMAARHTPHPDYIPFEHKVMFEDIPSQQQFMDDEEEEEEEEEGHESTTVGKDEKSGRKGEISKDHDNDDGDDSVEEDARSADRYPHVRLRMTRLEKLKSKLLHIPGRLNRLAYLHQQLLVAHNRVETVYSSPFGAEGDALEKRAVRQNFMRHTVPANMINNDHRKKKKRSSSKTRTSFLNHGV